MISIERGESPLILAFPHSGTEMPPEIFARLNDTGKRLADTDWYVDRLYRGLVDDVTIVHTDIHRYVVDVNRPPDGKSLYPGQNTTDLCPMTDFDGNPIYRDGRAPDADEIAARTARFHTPYHAALSTEIARVKAIHGFAILYDCHSIRSRIPYLFDKILPDFNIGTNLSTSCHQSVEKCVEEICRSADGFTCVLNGRFRGGWTTRHHGCPDAGIHAIQMELAQSAYMNEAEDRQWNARRAERLRGHLSIILNALLSIAETGVLK